MKHILAKILAINLLFLSCAMFSYSEEIILPKKKPNLSSELIEKKVSKNILLPKKKPIKLPIKKPKKKKNIQKEKKVAKIKGIIVPKSKPLIVKKSSSKIGSVENQQGKGNTKFFSLCRSLDGLQSRPERSS